LPSIFFSYYFLVHHPVNRDDRHLFAHAMASDFSVAWQFLNKNHSFHLHCRSTHQNCTYVCMHIPETWGNFQTREIFFFSLCMDKIFSNDII
jgi:hypothetical protein